MEPKRRPPTLSADAEEKGGPHVIVFDVLTIPVTAVVDSIEAAIDARSLANAREAAADTSLRALAHRALREGAGDLPVRHFPESA